jgi:hypothetical protein
MLRFWMMKNGCLRIELATRGHVWRFLVDRQHKAEMMRQVVAMVPKSDGGLTYTDADQICIAIRSAFPEPLTLSDVLLLEIESWKAKQNTLLKNYTQTQKRDGSLWLRLKRSFLFWED